LQAGSLHFPEQVWKQQFLEKKGAHARGVRYRDSFAETHQGHNEKDDADSAKRNGKDYCVDLRNLIGSNLSLI
jgi:hypothetical protein